MRQIKFRAWDKKEKKWLLGYDVGNLGGFSLFGECMLMDEWSAILNEYLFDRNGHTAEDLVVMQFTGLLDKNRKEIYEGDYFASGTFVGVVVYWRCAFGTGEGQDFTPLDQYVGEVIGNIYENPELLSNPPTSL